MTNKKYFFVKRHLTVRFLIYSALLLLSAIAALACGWSYITDHSVRFNSYRSGRGFYRLPPLPIMYDQKKKKELTQPEVENFGYDDGEYDPDSDLIATPDESDIAWEEAKTAIDNSQLDVAHDRLKKYLELSNVPTFDEEDERRSRRSSAYDILDAMTALKEGSTPESVKSYVITRLTDAEIPVNSESDRNLKDNWAYLKAARAYTSSEKENAMAAFKSHAAKYPRSEKHESVLYMIAKLTMESSYSFAHDGCGIEGTTSWGEPVDQSKIEPIEKCQDEAWRDEIERFKKLIAEYPNGRYNKDSKGWLAYLYYRGGMRAEALAEYYRLLGNTTDRTWRLRAKQSLDIVGQEQSDETLNKLENLIENEPDTAMAYAYHRIYNFAVDRTYNEADLWGDWQQRSEERTRNAKEINAGNHELERIAAFATAMVKRYPKSHISGGFVVRVAEAQLELQNYDDALEMARKAVSLGVKNDLRAQALWIEASVQHQKKDLASARTAINQLIREFPASTLSEDAHRLLALIAEDQGDLDTALEQYLSLHYRYDVAYYIDVLLPTDRLATFVTSHPNITEHNVLTYALAVRYMREKRWDQARIALRNVITEPGIPADYSGEDNPDGYKTFAKEPDWEERSKDLVKSSWVTRDMQTIDDLERLEKAVDSAQGDEAKAEAMYQLASYQYDADPLLFYDPAIWEGQRIEFLSQLNNSELIRLPGEAQNLFEYSKAHEPKARSIPIYLDIVDHYPQTKAAKDALYSAVIAHERLSDYNQYWRDLYERGFFAGPRLVDNSDINRLFPKFRWPKSRLGWEASTRTVDGGSAWPELPKPAPKLTRTQRLTKLLTRWWDTSLRRFSSNASWTFTSSSTLLSQWFYKILLIVAIIAMGYGALLWLHFRKTHSLLIGVDTSLALCDKSPEKLLDFESRMDKVIDAN
ncbi:MAG TPA: outer membrane protein assembly factor BamD [Pyrinomonadaceae bacterium]|jgi:outer membrane protein assembly factor BamD (BamD/ComL family)|nr:outer membrane protein assembly factor BamD [Pyrinomonadaceae bacterium]